MPRLGFEPLTPADSKSALITFAMEEAGPVQERLKRGRINARVGRHFIRLSPSVFNDMADSIGCWKRSLDSPAKLRQLASAGSPARADRTPRCRS